MENKNTERMDKPTEFLLTPEYERTQVNFCRKNITTELSSDFTLPDYLPEIRKMLGIIPRISPISRYISNNSAEFSGHVDYDMLYLGGDGTLSSAPLGTDFSFDIQPSIPRNIDWSSSNDVFADVETDMLHCRVTAPRKVNIKCRLRGLVRAYGYDEGSANIGRDARGCERLTAEPRTALTRRYMGEVAEISDEISPISPEMRPVYCTSSISIEDTNLSEKRLNCRGELISEIIYENPESGEISSEVKKTPFVQDIEIGDEIPVGYNVSGICGETRISEVDERFLLDTEVILEAETLSEINTNLIVDLFMPERESEAAYREFKYHSAEKAANVIFKAESSFPLSALSLSDNGEIIACHGTARAEGIALEGESCIIEGSCKLWVLMKNGGEYSSGELVLPFSFDTGVKTKGRIMTLACRPCTALCKCKKEGENILCEAEIPLSYSITGENSLMIAENFSAGEKSEKERHGITVYYPENGEKLWDVAKSYRSLLKSIAEANDLPSASGDEILDSNSFIIIN